MGIFDPDVVRVKVLGVRTAGVRTAMGSELLGTVNHGIYSLLLEHKNGKYEVIEVEYKDMNRYAKYIEW